MRGHVLALVAVSASACYLLPVKALGPRVRPAQVMAWTGASSCLALLPVTPLSGEAFWPRDLRA